MKRLAALAVAGALSLTACGDDRRYLTGADEHRAERALTAIVAACDTKAPVRTSRRRQFEAAIDAYLGLVGRNPDAWMESGIAYNADTTTRYTLVTWANAFASGECHDGADVGDRLVAGTIRLVRRDEIDRRG